MKRRTFAMGIFACLPIAGFVAAMATQATQDPPNSREVKLPGILSAAPLKEDPKDDELRKLFKARYNEAVAEMKVRIQSYATGTSGRHATIEVQAEAGQRLLRSGLALCDKSADTVALLTQNWEVTKLIEKLVEQRYQAGAAVKSEVHLARYNCLDAEIQLLCAKRETEGANKSILKSMLKERLDSLSEAVKLATKQYREGNIPFATLAKVQREAFKAALDLSDGPEARMASLRKFVAVVVENHKITQAQYNAGQITNIDVLLCRAIMLEAQIELAQEELKAKVQK